MKKEYKPKKKSYNDLTSLYKEMIAEGIKVTYFDGYRLETKHERWGMYEGRLMVWSGS
jgi:hypothetical protein